MGCFSFSPKSDRVVREEYLGNLKESFDQYNLDPNGANKDYPNKKNSDVFLRLLDNGIKVFKASNTLGKHLTELKRQVTKASSQNTLSEDHNLDSSSSSPSYSPGR